MKSKVIMIDIDGTICSEEKTFERGLALPLKDAIDSINDLFNSGHTIIFWTARGWEQYRITKHWLDSNGFNYHQLLMGKPIVDIFIDDRARQFVGWDKKYLEDNI